MTSLPVRKMWKPESLSMTVRVFFIAGLVVILMLSGGGLPASASEKGRQDNLEKAGPKPAGQPEKTGPALTASAKTKLELEIIKLKLNMAKLGVDKALRKKFIAETIRIANLAPLEVTTEITEEVQSRILRTEKNGITSYTLMDDVGLAGDFQFNTRIFSSVKGSVVLWTFDSVMNRILIRRQYLVAIKTGKILDYMQLKLTRRGYSPDDTNHHKKLFEQFDLDALPGGNCTEGKACVMSGYGICSVDTLTYQPIDRSQKYSVIANFPERFRWNFDRDQASDDVATAINNWREYGDTFWRTLGGPVGADILPDGTVVFSQGPQILFFSPELKLRNMKIGGLYIIRTSLYKATVKELYQQYCTPVIGAERQKRWGKCKIFYNDETCHLLWQAMINLAIYKALENDK